MSYSGRDTFNDPLVSPLVLQLVKEHLLGQAIIGKQSGKEKILEVDVICEFIAPVLYLSKQSLHFYVEKVMTPVSSVATVSNPISVPRLTNIFHCLSSAFSSNQKKN